MRRVVLVMAFLSLAGLILVPHSSSLPDGMEKVAMDLGLLPIESAGEETPSASYWGQPLLVRLLALAAVFSLAALLGSVRSGMYAPGRMGGLAQLDPTTKLATVLVVVPVVATAPAKSPLSLGFFAVLSLLLAWAVRLPPMRVLKGALILLPMGVLLVVGLFFPRAGHGVPVLCHPVEIRFHPQRLVPALAVAVRSFSALLCALSLLRGISLESILLALPPGGWAALVAGAMGNFMLTFTREIESMRLARQARAPRMPLPGKMRLAANCLGMLLLRAHLRSEALALALRARGWGTVSTPPWRPHLQGRVVLAGAVVALVGRLLVLVESG